MGTDDPTQRDSARVPTSKTRPSETPVHTASSLGTNATQCVESTIQSSVLKCGGLARAPGISSQKTKKQSRGRNVVFVIGALTDVEAGAALDQAPRPRPATVYTRLSFSSSFAVGAGAASFELASSPMACAVATQLRSHATAAMKYSASMWLDRPSNNAVTAQARLATDCIARLKGSLSLAPMV